MHLRDRLGLTCQGPCGILIKGSPKIETALNNAPRRYLKPISSLTTQLELAMSVSLFTFQQLSYIRCGSLSAKLAMAEDLVRMLRKVREQGQKYVKSSIVCTADATVEKVFRPISLRARYLADMLRSCLRTLQLVQYVGYVQHQQVRSLLNNPLKPFKVK
ncbi:hypothetical protein AcW1_010209 [Taiwanofungus camphoratus]|nr:hypothetical protein AcW1_010209 [Antrodia cinnamomea]KAI0954382.1 hypothetical protein AcV7_007634 [Antrodia cinnamomea]